jgi:hypothetical protein
VEGHWKDIISRPHLQDQGVEVLNQMQLMCTTLFPSGANHFHVIFTTLTMSPQDSVTHLLRSFNTSKRQAEEDGLTYTEDCSVYFLLGMINKSNRP